MELEWREAYREFLSHNRFFPQRNSCANVKLHLPALKIFYVSVISSISNTHKFDFIVLKNLAFLFPQVKCEFYPLSAFKHPVDGIP